MGSGKRKRSERTYSQDGNEGSRPSPHRPGNLNLAQQNQAREQQHQQHQQYQDYRGRGGRRGSRGGRGGAGSSPRSPQVGPSPARQNGQPLTAMSPTASPTPQRENPRPPPQSITQTAPPAASRQPQQAEPKKPSTPPPYSFEYVTDERLGVWRTTGRQTVIDIGLQARAEGEALTLGSLFQELIKSSLYGRIDATEAGTTIRDIITTAPMPEPDAVNGLHKELDLQSLFLDCLSILAENDVAGPSLRSLILATQVSPELMRQELETSLLQSLGMIRSTFGRVGIRKQTNLLYRQSNYNLLREESEGYSKLVTELFTTSNNEPPTSEVVGDTFERVKALIGAFDLDVGRVLDVTLDIFAAVLVKQFRFFVKFLRSSSWWPKTDFNETVKAFDQEFGSLPKWALPGSAGWSTSDEDKVLLLGMREKRDRLFWERVREVGMGAYFEIGGRKSASQEERDAAAGGDGENGAQIDEDHQWIKTTGTIPPQGNRVAAQLLGFKLRFYASSARDSHDVLPVNLIYLAALLIKIGFISLRDLYPHLWPLDEHMEAVKAEKMKEKAEKERLKRPGGGAKNALMMAGALADDTFPQPPRLREPDASRGTPSRVETEAEKTATAAKQEESEKLPEHSDQKVQLLRSLLCIGAIPESLYILGRFPWLLDAFPDLPAYIHRILHHSLSKVYDSLRPLEERETLRKARKVPASDQSGLSKGQLRLIDPPTRKVLRWAELDRDDTNEATDYRFYWDEWADNVPICQSVDDVFSLCGTLLNLSGVKIGQDPSLLLKLTRIGKKSLASDDSSANVARWIDLSKRLLVPALSLTTNNPGVVNEVFDLLRNFSTSTRYSIYAEWYSGQISRLPDIKAAFDQARAETKDVMKRISKTNVKPMARALAKVAYASPGIVFQVAISQIEAYDNLVEVVVECARYFTFLGYDVLTWSLMSSLGVEGRSRVQANGMLTSKWLRSLSLFAGRVFKRYSIMNPTPILQYVTEKLRNGSTDELRVLKEITTAMAGIVADTNFNEAQTIAMAGGELLQSQTLLQLLDKRHESKTTARRLIRSLTEPKLAGQLLISIAQVRQTCIFRYPEEMADLKVIGSIFDEVQRVFTQFLDLLRNNLSVKDFDSLVPDVVRLIDEFGLDPSVAFWISRPSLSQALTEADKPGTQSLADSEKSQESRSTDTPEADPTQDVVMEDSVADSVKQEGETPINGSDEPMISDQDMKDSSLVVPNLVKAGKSPAAETPWHPVLQSLMEQVRPLMPEDFWTNMSLPFYVTFWQLSTNDVNVPTQSYEDEINRLFRKETALTSDRSDMSAAGLQRKEKEKKSLNDMQVRLRTELKGQIQAYSMARNRLQKEKDHWFADFWGKWDHLNDALIQNCFLPRLLISSSDVLYTVRMIKYLHSSGTPNFRTMGVIDRIFREKQLAAIIFICTSQEAENFGRFLNELLKDLSRWHADQPLYEKEAFGLKKDLPGYAKKMNAETGPETFLDYEEFRRLLYKWHRNLNSALKSCFVSGEYMHIRNAIIVLKAVCQYFPAVNWNGRDQVTAVTQISKVEQRDDLKIAALSLLGNLKRREKQWMLPQAFNLIEPSAGAAASRASSARPATPQTDPGAAKSLNAAASEFKPKPQSNVNGNGKGRTTSDRMEVEDGEVEDAKMSDFTDGPTKSSDVPAPGAHELQDTEQPVQLKPVAASDPILQSEPAEKKPSDPAPISTPAVSEYRTVTPKPSQQDRQKPGQLESQRSTPSTTPSNQNPPSVSEPDRMLEANGGPGRPQHALPNRPEPPNPYNRRMAPERVGPPERVGDRRDGRDQRYAEHNRPDRPGDLPRDFPHDRRSPTPSRRALDRLPDRPANGERDRREPARGGDREMHLHLAAEDRYGRSPARDSRPGSREGEWHDRIGRDRPGPPDLRTQDYDRPARDSVMGPPRSAIAHHPDRAALINGPQHPDRQALISGSQHPDRLIPNSSGQHPERGAYMNGSQDRRPEPPRSDRDERRDRSSRGQSPRRPDDRRAPGHYSRTEGQWDERPPLHERASSGDLGYASRRYEETHPPTGPRGDRPGRSSQDFPPPADRSRELFQPSAAPPPPLDPNHGRLNRDPHSDRQQDPNYGRLNAGPEIPSGPRARLQGDRERGNRVVSAPQPQMETRHPEQPPQSQGPQAPDRHPPTGPASRRGPPRPGPQYEQSSAPSAPSTPSTETATTDMSGVHPDRLRAFQITSDTPGYANPPQQQASAAPPAQVPSPGPLGPPPSGPRGSFRGPPNSVAPPPPSRNPPTGPASTSDRVRGDKRFAGLQTVLQQAGSSNGPDRDERSTSIRGRGGRASSGGMPSPMTSGPPVTNMSRGDAMLGRPDLFASRAGGPPTPGTEDERTPTRDHRRESLRDNERRSGRHHPSRSDSRGHEDDNRRDEERGSSRRDEHRERRSAASGRDEREGRRIRDEREEKDPREYREELPIEEDRSRGGRKDDRDRERRERRKRGRAGEEAAPADRERNHGSKRMRRAP